MKRFRELRKALGELKAMDPKEVETAFYPLENLKRTEKPLPDFFVIHNRIMVMKHPYLSYLWLEYKEKHPDGYQLSQFYKLYKDFISETSDRKRYPCRWSASLKSVCTSTESETGQNC